MARQSLLFELIRSKYIALVSDFASFYVRNMNPLRS